jgi:hypothetical protein
MDYAKDFEYNLNQCPIGAALVGDPMEGPPTMRITTTPLH